jgi:dienelactone hydrolase
MVRRKSRPVWAVVVLLAVMAVDLPVVPVEPVSAGGHRAPECAGELGDPVSGSAGWDRADLDNQRCAVAGLRMIQDNPAVAAAVAANAAAGAGDFGGDPFRAPHRWAGRRGSYAPTTYTDRDGNRWPAALFGPRDLRRGPYPGVLLVCHACIPTIPQSQHIWYWAAEALAESGYVVLYATVGGNSVPRATDATDFLVSTPDAPTPRGDVNPWHASLDRSRLGIIGHSGAGGVALNVGHADPRYDAVVAWDPAGSATLDVAPRVPTMVQVADYRQEAIPPARHERPVPALPKFTFFDTISAAGVDAMQVAVRASMHFEWSRFPSDPNRPHSIYGEAVATYYTLAWLDRYLAPARGWVPSRIVALDALRRLTASGNRRFDRSADVRSIGVGTFDARKAARAGSVEAGNVPVTIRGLHVRNLLSFHYDSRYSLERGALRCTDMRAGC